MCHRYKEGSALIMHLKKRERKKEGEKKEEERKERERDKDRERRTFSFLLSNNARIERKRVDSAPLSHLSFLFSLSFTIIMSTFLRLVCKK